MEYGGVLVELDRAKAGRIGGGWGGLRAAHGDPKGGERDGLLRATGAHPLEDILEGIAVLHFGVVEGEREGFGLIPVGQGRECDLAPYRLCLLGGGRSRALGGRALGVEGAHGREVPHALLDNGGRDILLLELLGGALELLKGP